MEINRTTDLPAPQSLATRQAGALGRDTGFNLAGTDYGVSYAYDSVGRFSQVSNFQFQVSYSYLQSTDLISGMTASSGFLWSRAYESARSLITAVENRFGETVISRYDYANDELGRRTSRVDSGLAFAAQPTYGDSGTVEMPAYNAYSYNIRSEVTGAARRWGTPEASGDQVLGQQYTYEFDDIGNRITAAEGDTDRTANYTANELNQYTQRTVPGEKDLIGTAPTNVAVTVNQNPVSRQFAYWHHALEVDNSTDAAYPNVAITAVNNPPGTNAPDVVTSQTGRVFVAETPESFTYDDDGNLTQDGRFDYTWNGENRLIIAETRDDLPTAVPRVKVEYSYDHQGRMVWKQISTNAVILSTRTLLWDGYNIIQALTHSQTHTLTNSFLWGLDLSGSLQGAGGVGGLLAEVKDGEPYFAAFDANGNVTEYVSTDGTLAAHYEYSPFGEIVVQSGPLADTFTHRFSTKPWCGVTGLSEYEYRKCRPEIGRWLSRDPIGERGGVLLYTVCGNNAMGIADSLGLVAIRWPPDDPIGFPKVSPIDLVLTPPYPETPIPSPGVPPIYRIPGGSLWELITAPLIPDDPSHPHKNDPIQPHCLEEGYYRHCRSTCLLARRLRIANVVLADAIALIAAGTWGGDWPGMPDASWGDWKSNFEGIKNGYGPDSCTFSCAKSFYSAFNTKCCPYQGKTNLSKDDPKCCDHKEGK